MTITEAILSRAIELAAVKAAELAAERVAKELSGEVLHGSPISPHCEAVLTKPPACWDFRGIRSWVMCRSWQLMEDEKLTQLPVGRAWAEARQACVREA